MTCRSRLFGCLLLTAAAAVTAACSSEATLSRPVVVGAKGTTVVLAADGPGRRALAHEITAFTRTPERVEIISGSAGSVAESVMDGRPIDVVVLPAGPEMDRIRGELLAPPVQLGVLNGTSYLAAAVTTRGRPFLVALGSARGAAMLRAGGLT